MKTQKLRKVLLVTAAAAFAWCAWKAKAQDSGTVPVPNAVAPIIQLEQAKIGDDTIIAYIKSTGNTYNLNAGQIIYLRQQGISEAVIAAMLAQQKVVAEPAPIPAPATATVQTGPAVVSATVTPATVAYVQTAPVAYYPYYYSAGYNYGWPRPLFHPWVGVGWGWGWHGGWHVGVAF